MKRLALITVLSLSIATLSACAALGSKTKTTPRQAESFKQTYTFPAEKGTVLEAILLAARKLGLEADTSNGSNAIRLDKREIIPVQLDTYCLSPFVKTEDGSASGSFSGLSSGTIRGASGFVRGRVSMEILLSDYNNETKAETYSDWSIYNVRALPRCQSKGVFEREFEQAIIQVIKNPLPPIVNADGTVKASLKGVTVGTPRTALLEHFPGFRCGSKKCESYPSAAKNGVEDPALFKLGSALVDGYHVSLYENQLGYMSAVFSHRWYENVKSALIEKYGNPTKEKTETVQNKFGATYINHITTWAIGEDFIQIEDLGVDLETSLVRLFAKWYPVAEEVERRERAKEDAKNL